MPRKPKRSPDDPEESSRFIAIARELGADETDEKGFERAFKAVVPSAKPPHPQRRARVHRGSRLPPIAE